MASLAGEPIIDIVTLRDTTGAVVTGATFTVLYSKHQNGTAATTTVEETASPGTYLISTETDTTGGYHRIAQATKDGSTYAFAGTAHVVSRGSPFEHYIDSAVQEVIYLLDDAGAGLSGVTFDTEISSDPNGDPFTLTATAIAGVPGGYIISVVPDAVGVWSAEVVTDTTPERRFRFEAVAFDPAPLSLGAAINAGGQVTWQRVMTWRGTVSWSRLT
jgi:hypothetical protein